MKLIWTKNDTIVSRFIRWGLREPVSHFAIVFNDSFVLHSNFLGVNICWFDHFKKSQTVVFYKDLPHVSKEMEEIILRSIAQVAYGKKYDFKALAFFTWRALIRRFFGVPFPKRNSWNERDAYMCEEMYEVIPDEAWITPRPELADDIALMSPYQIYLLERES